MWLWALLVLLPLLGLALWVRRGRRVTAERWADPALLPAVALAGRAGPRRTAAVLLALVAVAAGILAMARPSVVATSQERQSTVMLTVDISTSMNRIDLSPNRLAAAVDAADRFLTEVPDDTAVGLVTFSDGARVVVAPTRDRDRVRAALSELETVHGETALGEAVMTALGSLQSVGATGQAAAGSGEAAGRILILTDGIDSARLAATPAQAAARAAELGVPIFPLLLGDDPGQEGQATPAETLAQMATTTGGIFAQSTTSADLRAVFADIGSVVAPVERLRELSVWCALVALVALLGALACLALPGRRARRTPVASAGGQSFP